MTTETKVTHTPGPWEIEHPGHLLRNTPVIESASGRVAMVRRDEDADLIAAAPDMLEALEHLTGAVRTAHNVYQSAAAKWLMDTASFQKAEAAIAKAKGGAA